MLLSLLTHLQRTFKIWYRKMYPTVGEQMQSFLLEFDSKFENNLAKFQQFLASISEFRELSHLKGKWPRIDPNLAHELSLVMKMPMSKED